jgi:protein-disulfide isomerase
MLRGMSRLKTALDLVVTVLIAVAAGFLLWRQIYPAGPPAPPNQVEDAKGRIEANEISHARGTARLALIEFADYQCPFCARHASEVAPALRREFLESGQIREVFVNFPLRSHALAQKASEAGECAARQGRFWEMHDSLFKEPESLDPPSLTRRARDIGLELPAFEQCLNAGQTAPLVARQTKIGRDLAVTGTPAFFIGIVQADGSIELKKRINGFAPLDRFQQLITELTPGRRAAN